MKLCYDDCFPDLDVDDLVDDLDSCRHYSELATDGKHYWVVISFLSRKGAVLDEARSIAFDTEAEAEALQCWVAGDIQ